MSSAPALESAPVRWAFSSAVDGDLRASTANRARFARKVGAPRPWAEVRQVHGSAVVEARGPGQLGEADSVFTRLPGLSLAVFVADCMAVVIEAKRGVGVAHAGWRGAASGVVGTLVERMAAGDLEPVAAHLGPFIGSCCFEVGPEVAELFPGATAQTMAGTVSVDLRRAVASQLSIPLDPGPGCTFHEETYLSHRRMSKDMAAEDVGRMVALAWLEGP